MNVHELELSLGVFLSYFEVRKLSLLAEGGGYPSRHLSGYHTVSRTGTGDGCCFCLIHDASDSKHSKKHRNTTGAHSARGPTGQMQQHSNAVVAFAVPGRGGECLEVLDVLTVKWATGDLPEECRFLVDTQLLFQKEKEPSTKMFDDLTEAEAITADIPKVQVTQASQGETSGYEDVDPRRCDPFRWENLCEHVCQGDSWRSVKERSQHS